MEGRAVRQRYVPLVHPGRAELRHRADAVPHLTGLWTRHPDHCGSTVTPWSLHRTALRLARYFGTSERFWINLQARYDFEAEKDRLGAALDTIQPLNATG